MYEIRSEGLVMARLIKSDELFKKGLNFFSNEDEYLQIGGWRYDSETVLKAHNHNKVVREIHRTQELLYVKSGSLEAYIYDEEDLLIETITLEEGDILVVLRGGHGYRILNDDTCVMEIKNGPYLGPELDRRRL